MGKYDKLKKQNDEAIEKVRKEAANFSVIADESRRVADVAHHAGEIISDLDRQFAKATGLDGKDIAFLFLATGLQIARWVLLNQITKIEKAGQDNVKEKYLHERQEKRLKKIDGVGASTDSLYYASLEHIISTKGVPYDATNYMTNKSVEKMMGKGKEWTLEINDLIIEKLSLFKGANHRFSTLGHDPVIGLLIGTSNIMTNTITCVKEPIGVGGVRVPIITTNHVVYTADYKNPQISVYASTIIMLQETKRRIIEEPMAWKASVIKQITHIGTDLFTPCGIQFPAANLILSNTDVESITRHIGTGDILKVGLSAAIQFIINTLIETVHGLLYDERKFSDRKLYEVKTRKILSYSNMISSASNIIWVGDNMIAGNEKAVKDLDVGGLLVTIHRLLTDYKFIQSIKQEFLQNQWYDIVMGEELRITEED